MFEVLSLSFWVNGTTLVMAILAIIISQIYRRAAQKSQSDNFPPGPPGLPIFGNFFDIALSKINPKDLLFEWSMQYGKIYSFKVFGDNVVIINDEDLIREAFKSNDIVHRQRFKAFEILAGGRTNTGIVFSNGPGWREHRKFFLTNFRKVDLGVCKLEDIVREQVGLIISDIQTNKKKSIDPNYYFDITVANIVLRIITGVTHKWDNQEFLDVVKNTRRLFVAAGPAALYINNTLLISLPTPMTLELRKLLFAIFGFIQDTINKHKAEYDTSTPPKDFVESYLQETANPDGNQKTFDDINLAVSCFDTLVAGWEAVATVLSWSAYFIANNPKAQEKMRKEIWQVVGRDRYPTLADRTSLPYTEATIMEAMRIGHAVPIHLPHMANRDTKIAGYDIPKGTIVAGSLHNLCLNPFIWKEPNTFKPERFLDKDGNYLRNLEPLPFGSGKRSCAGEQLARIEVYLYIACLFQNYKMSVPPNAPPIEGDFGVTWRPRSFELSIEEVNKISK